MASQWYYKRIVEGREPQELGPFTSPQFSRLAANGTVLPTDLVRRNESRWVLATKVRGLFGPVPGESFSPSVSDSASPSASESASPSAEESPPPSISDTVSQALGESLSPLLSDTLGESVVGTVSISESPVADVGDAGENPGNSTADEDPAAERRRIKMGSRLGNYRILRLLGRGGVGVVLKAEHVRMKRAVAVKVLRSRVMRSRRGLQRFQQEVRAAGRLTHPNIVTAYDADEVDGLHFLVMEFVDGSNLSRHVRKRGPLPVLEALDYMIQTASGLDYAHREGIIHRDIKPSNLLVDPHGTIKILDLGFASIQNPEGDGATAAVTQRNQLLGTFDYMSPEQAEDPRSVDLRADIYSLGCTLYRLLTGELPYPGETTLHKILAHRDQPIPKISAHRPEVPPELDAFLERMLAKKREDRPQSMSEVGDELTRIFDMLKPITP
ncbi:MAG: serine/threonine-protein kinase [Planctomycetota bacterium]